MVSKKNLPNLITLMRLSICPLIIIIILSLNSLGIISVNYVAMIMAIIFLSDFFDGYFARKYAATTTLGALFDGLADKLIIYAILLFYLNRHELCYLSIYFLLMRDFLIVSLKHYAAEKKIKIDVVWSAKLKFTLECLLAFSLLYKFFSFSNILLVIIVIVAWYSAIEYYLNFLKKYYS
jgi:CDP-diacylglycerol--glycerol-3-phosphate 3-phosphatidyltransferase